MKSRLLILGIFCIIATLASGYSQEQPPQPILPMIVEGTITLNDEPAPMGTRVAAVMESIQAGEMVVGEEGKYALLVNGDKNDTGKLVEFFVYNEKTSYTLNWASGEVKHLDMSLEIDEPEDDSPSRPRRTVDEEDGTPTTSGPDEIPEVGTEAPQETDAPPEETAETPTPEATESEPSGGTFLGVPINDYKPHTPTGQVSTGSILDTSLIPVVIVVGIFIVALLILRPRFSKSNS
ncbi:MAG: hypothetical protein JXB14_00525 [Candidatus Altiarchaeota archaeon]|nr:hypothetical protein [Candidatus Altiarchaeota archaeon]